jgi:hypothetical protein
MNPNACLNRFIEAIRDRDHKEMRQAAGDLADWIQRGGFAPDLWFFAEEMKKRVEAGIWGQSLTTE